MDTFYKIVLIVATVMLLLILITIGTLIQQDGRHMFLHYIGMGKIINIIYGYLEMVMIEKDY